VKKLLLFLCAAFAWLALVEMACYAYLRLVPARFNPLAFYLEGMIKNFHPLLRPQGGTPTHKYYPYVGFYTEGRWDKAKPPVPSYPDGWVIPLGQDREGRERYALPEKPKGAIRVIILGGSTMAGMGQSSEEARISARLEALLRRAYPGKTFEVVNSAVYTYTAVDELVLLATKIVNFQPDLLLVMDGYNEFIRAYYFPDLPPFWGIFQEFLTRTYKRTQNLSGTLAQLGYLLSKRLYCLAIPRALYEKYGSYRRDMVILDNELYARMLADGVEVGVIRRPLAVRRIHGGQVTHKWIEEYPEAVEALKAGGTPPEVLAAEREKLVFEVAGYLWRNLQPARAREFLLAELGPSARASRLYALTYLPPALLSAAKEARKRWLMARHHPAFASAEVRAVYALIDPLIAAEERAARA